MSTLDEKRRGRNSCIDVTLTLLVFVHAIVGILFAACILLTLNVRHTYFDPQHPIGELVSDRFVTLRWWTYFLTSVSFLAPAFVILIWIAGWLKTSFWRFFWNACLWIVMATCLLTVASLGSDYSNCNGQNQKGNLCNSQLYCCVPEINSNTNNGCPTLPMGGCNAATNPAVPIPATVADLQPDGLFMWLHWTNVGLAISCFLMVMLATFQNFYEDEYVPLSNVRRKKRSVNDFDVDEIEDVSSKFGRVVTASRRRGKSPSSKRGKSGTGGKARLTTTTTLEIPESYQK